MLPDHLDRLRGLLVERIHQVIIAISIRIYQFEKNDELIKFSYEFLYK